MENKQISEGNKLIAEFMGLKPVETFGRYSISKDHCTCREDTAEQAMKGFASIAKYHSDWNWLMPVWEKIVDLRDGFCVPHGKFLVKSIYQSLYIVNIERTWKEIIEFIQWYNNQ